MVKQHFDVIIIGAGAAGLKAAKELRGSGKSVCILEARNRTGGRIKKAKILDKTVDIGGGWVNKEQELLLREAKNYGLEIRRQYAQGNSMLDLYNSLSYFNNEQFGLSFLANLSLNKAMRKLEQNAITIPINQPWECNNAREWDSQTLQNWINTNVTNAQARAYFETSVTAELSIEPSKISYLYFLQLVRADQLLEKEPAGVEGAWSYVVEGGLHQLFDKISDDLQACIHLNQAVKSVTQDSSSITAYTEDHQYTGRYCIIAIPPTLTSRIEFSPSFSARRNILIQSMPMGSAVKSYIAYKEPFWRKNKHSGIIITNTAPYMITLDATPLDESFGMIVAVSCGSSAINLSDCNKEKRQNILEKQLTHYFGQSAQTPIDYTDNDWTAEAWSQSGYCGYLPPGILTTLKGELSFPSGRIHWAGAETSTQWHGAVEGALLSGVRAAHEVLKKLN